MLVVTLISIHPSLTFALTTFTHHRLFGVVTATTYALTKYLRQVVVLEEKKYVPFTTPLERDFFSPFQNM